MRKKNNSRIYLLIAMVFTVLFTNGCKKESNNTPTILKIGQNYQGGIIAYILKPGDHGYDANVQHGLIAAPTDQSDAIKWWNGANTTTAATATSIGSGSDNTSTIFNSQGTGNYAAKICYDLVLGGYSDWFLPSKDEIRELYMNRTSIGGFSEDYYWSSSERSFETSFVFLFKDGYEDPSYFWYFTKISELKVRAVRAF